MAMQSSEKTNRPTEDYRIYTTKFDIEVPAGRIDAVLGPLSPKDEAILTEA